MSNRLRRKLYVDPKIQGALITRVAAYWFFCLWTVVCLLFCWTAVTERPESSTALFSTAWARYLPVMAASLLVLPLVVIDVLRLSNRFVGPLVRLRRAMQQLSDGQTPSPLKFRDNDMCNDLAEQFNRVVERFQSSQGATPETAEAPDETEAEPVAV